MMTPAEIMRKLMDEINGVPAPTEEPVSNHASPGKHGMLCELEDKYGIYGKPAKVRKTKQGSNDSPLTYGGTEKWKNEKDFFKKYFSRPFLTKQGLAEGQEISGKQLLTRFKGKILPYSKLPKPAQDSLTRYMVGEGENEDYQKQRYGYAEVPTRDIMKLVYDQNNEGQSFDDFWDVSKALSFRPKYPKTSIWPIIWGGYGMEDGYHRLERYIKLGIPTIPVVIII